MKRKLPATRSMIDELFSGSYQCKICGFRMKRGSPHIENHLDEHAKSRLLKQDGKIPSRGCYPWYKDWLDPARSTKTLFANDKETPEENPVQPKMIVKVREEDSEQCCQCGEDIDQHWDQDEDSWIFSGEVVRVSKKGQNVLYCNLCSKDSANSIHPIEVAI